MIAKISIIALIMLSVAFAEQKDELIAGLTEAEWHKLLRQKPVGICHGASSVTECIRWVNDSATVKKEKHPDYKWEQWRHCCTMVRDSIDAAKAMNKKKKR